ncbi:MAG: pyridoxamine 5'-phosphate oxidase family protein [Mycobacteriales bacterium]
MQWHDLEQQQPRLAHRAYERLIAPGVVLVATIRRDGTPRLSPVEPFLLDGGLWLSMLWQSRKAVDLKHDPRLLVHGIVTNRDGADGEVKVRGHARAEDDEAVQRRYADAVAAALGWSPLIGRFHLFKVEIGDVVSIRYGDDGDQFVARWPPAREFVRRGTSATSIGNPEPVRDLLD